jgi:hypothetical protein
MSGTDVCPCCPKQATSKGGHVRSDSLRTHVKNKHSESFDLEFIDAGGWSLRALTPKLVIKHRAGKLGFGYCFDCYHWIDTTGFNQANIEKFVRSHICIQPQIRERKCKVVNGTVVVSEKTMNNSMLYKELKAAGADDWIELADNNDVDIKATFRKLVMAAKTSAPAVSPEGSFLDRLKKDKRLTALNFEEWEQERRDAIEADAELDPEDRIGEVEVYDDWDSVIVTKLDDLQKRAAKSDKLSTALKEARYENGTKEDEKDMIKRDAAAAKEESQARLNEMARQLSEARNLLHAAEARLKQELGVAPDEGRDTIQHQGGSDFSQWSLPYQG